ncbi:MAG: HAD family phosphatase [Gemmatimonadetes bacterium]|nr:HAD family phosphatase [Gemmatimonadota bacterium]MDA1104888.1 HAD family phosphatase [Gemmatimonadota bacterium]
MSVECVLWDHDGVIVDTEPLFFEATARALADHGIAVERDRWAALQASGEGIVRLLEEARFGGGRQAGVRRVRDELYADLLGERDVLIEGARSAVEEVTGRYRSALVTTSLRRYLDQIHGSSGLLGHFAHIVTAEDCSRHKPHPEPYLRAMELVGARPEACIAIEDSPRGLASARAAGVRCVVVRSDFIGTPRFEAATHVLDSVAEFGPFLAQLG